jgi:predicted RNA-binding Zn ribbon-like protein
MDFAHYTDYPVQLAMDLVNTRDPVDESDRIADVAGLEAFLEEIAEHLWHPDWAVTGDDVADVRRLRLQLRAVFNAESDADAAVLLNEVLATAGASPRVSVHGGRPHLHFEPEESGVAGWLGAVAAMGLSVVLCDHRSKRLGVCNSSTCQDVYIDTSRNCSRRYCSDTCSSRENVAAYRRRHAAG